MARRRNGWRRVLELARRHLAAAGGLSRFSGLDAKRRPENGTVPFGRRAWRAGLAPHAPYSVHPESAPRRGEAGRRRAGAGGVSFGRIAGGNRIFANRRRPLAPIVGGPGCLASRSNPFRHAALGLPPRALRVAAGAGDPRQLPGRRGGGLSRGTCRADGARLLPADPRLVRPSALAAGEDAFLGGGDRVGDRQPGVLARSESLGRTADAGRPALCRGTPGRVRIGH